MSMTLSNAKIAVARVAGAHNDTNKLAVAADAIKAVAQEWSNKHNWEYLRKDNANTYTMAVTVSASTTCTVASTAGLNVGQAFVLNAVNATISSISSTTVFIASVTVTTGTATFAAYIPIIAGTSEYYLPSDFKDFYSARLLTTLVTLEVVRAREVDRKVGDQASTTTASAIMPASPGSGAGFTAADQRPRCRIVGVPGTTENMLLKYYRGIDGLADPIDIPTDLESIFIDAAKVWFLAQLNANDPRIDILGALSKRALDDAISADMSWSDEDVRMKSQMETMQEGNRRSRYVTDRWDSWS